MQRLDGPRWITFLYNHNPFYLISACLVLFGIQSAFNGSGTGEAAMVDPWVLGGMLAGYTTLLALTGFLVVRFGGVWDDARTIFMILLLMFFALSVSFDSLCVSSPSIAITMLILGFLFAVVVTESILRSLGIKFPPLFKVPYYLMLAVSFFYPLMISARNAYFSEFDIRWLLALFPMLCAVTILSGIPAIRKNAKYVLKNGTPWHWPLFPYSVFALLTIGLCGRVVLLTMAFDPSSGAGSIFGSYFLVPIYLAVLIAVFEIGVTEKSDGLREVVLMLSAFAIPLAINWSHDFGQVSFVNELTQTVGAPIWLALMALVGFYFFTWIREVDNAVGVYLTIALAVACCLKVDGTIVNGIGEVIVWPCCALAVLQVGSVARRQSSARWMVVAGLMGLIVGKYSLLLDVPGMEMVLPVHWILFAIVAIGFWFTDRMAIQLRIAGAMMISLLAAASWLSLFWVESGTMEIVARIAHAALLSVVAVGIFAWRKDRLYLYASLASFVFGLLITLTNVSLSVDDRYQDLAWFSSIGLACFVIGAIVSSLKAGLAVRLKDEFHFLVNEIRQRFVAVEQTKVVDNDST